MLSIIHKSIKSNLKQSLFYNNSQSIFQDIFCLNFYYLDGRFTAFVDKKPKIDSQRSFNNAYKLVFTLPFLYFPLILNQQHAGLFAIMEETREKKYSHYICVVITSYFLSTESNINSNKWINFMYFEQYINRHRILVNYDDNSVVTLIESCCF